MTTAQEHIQHIQDQIARRAERPEEAHGEEEAVLVFLLAGERYAFSLTAVREISRVRPVTPLPGLPATVLGAAGLRGEVLPVIDLRRLLALPEAPPTGTSRLLVVHHEGITAALLADQVEDIATLPRGSVLPPPVSATGEAPAFLQGIALEGQQTTRLLDLPRLLEAVRHGR